MRGGVADGEGVEVGGDAFTHAEGNCAAVGQGVFDGGNELAVDEKGGFFFKGNDLDGDPLAHFAGDWPFKVDFLHIRVLVAHDGIGCAIRVAAEFEAIPVDFRAADGGRGTDAEPCNTH